MSDDSFQVAQRYLKHHNVLSLATCDGEIPWVAPVFYATWSDKLIFLSASHTRHCRNIAANPRVSASITEDYREWAEIKGFQLQGLVHQLKSHETASAIETYSNKYPVTGPDAPVEIASALDRISWYALDIEEIFFIDNSKGLGHRDQLDVGLLLGK